MSQVWLHGIHSVEGALKLDADRIDHLCVARGNRNKRLQALVREAQKAGIRIEEVDRRELDKRAGNEHHQGVLASYQGGESWQEADLLAALEKADNPLLLVLDGVQDPRNLGACLRSANAAGVLAVVIPKDRAASLTPAARKAAAGAAEHTPIVEVTNLARCLDSLKEQGVWMVGLAGEAEQYLYEVDLKGGIALVMGNEEKGLRRLTRDKCDWLAALPMAGTVSSLNVSAAATACLFEAVRQRTSSKV